METRFNLKIFKSRYSIIVFATATLVIFLLLLLPSRNNKISMTLFTTCAIDKMVGGTKVGDTWEVSRNTQIIAQGWAADRIKKTKLSDIFLELVDAENNVVKTVVSKSDFRRPDVAKAYNNPALEYSGFNFGLGIIEIPGEYTILAGNINDGQKQICINPFKIRVS